MKKKQLPILIIIPHGGYRVPEELSGHEVISDFDLFIQADTCANDLFSFGENISAKIDTDISRFFIDIDRHYSAVLPSSNGVIKKSTLFNKPVFKDDTFPDEIAISNLLYRYYFPFHNAIEKILKTGAVELIIECHTMMPVGPTISPDPGKPRPIAAIENRISVKNSDKETCPDAMALDLRDQIEKSLSSECDTVTDKFTHLTEASSGYIMKKYGPLQIPMMRLSLSKSLFLNDKYFSYDYLRVDDIRINSLKKLLWNALEKFFSKAF